MALYIPHSTSHLARLLYVRPKTFGPSTYMLTTCFRVDEKLRVRVTDNALSRDLFPTDYYCLGDNENRPIKWLAIESLLHKQFTGASDVVSIT